MVPIYSITSWLSLVFPSSEPTLSTIRDCYEAYMIYTFMAFLIAVRLCRSRAPLTPPFPQILGEERGLNAAVNIFAASLLKEERERLKLEGELEKYDHPNDGFETDDEEIGSRVELLKQHQRSHQPAKLKKYSIQPPFYCCVDQRTLANPNSLAASVLDQSQALAMQFVLLKPLLAIVPLILESSGIPYHAHNIVTPTHEIDWSSPKLYIYLLLNISVAFAFYGLVIFYQATEKLLAWCDPWPKFICIKGIVFMTFWQGIAITGMSIAGIVDEKSALAAQNMLICIEMLLASVMHHLFFPYQEWQEVRLPLPLSCSSHCCCDAQGYKKEKEREMMNLKDLLAFRDFIGDVKGIIFRRAWEGVPVSGIDTPPPPGEGDKGAEISSSSPALHRLANRSPSLGARATPKQVELIESVLDDILDESAHQATSDLV
jgi:hypothetical protein